MEHVGEVEGTSFIHDGAFTINDLIILRKIEAEIDEEYESKSG